MLFGSLALIRKKKKKRKVLSEFDPTLTKLSGSAHVIQVVSKMAAKTIKTIKLDFLPLIV